MANIAELVEDPYLIQHLNPLFLDALKGYWKALKNAQVSEEEKPQIREALYNLTRFAFRHLFKSLYLKYSPKVNGTVFLFSAVHSDGIGDYMALLKCARLLKESHPEIDVQIAYTHKQTLPLIDPAFYHLKKETIHDFHETEDPISAVLEGVLEGKTAFPFADELKNLQQERQKISTEYEALKENHPQAAEALKEMRDEIDKPIHQYQHFLNKKVEAEHLYEKMKESVALIHIALALNTFDHPQLATKSLYFAESGNFQGIANYLQRNWFSMGLDPFEEGIFFKAESKPSKWITTKLTRYLWNAEQPTEEKLKLYFKKSSIHVGYLPRIPEQRQIFIEMICHQHVHDDRHIDIILPYSDHEFQMDAEMLTAYGISKVICVDCSHALKETVLAEVNLPSDKYLRLIYALPLPSSDFIQFMHLSGEIVGCTGDGSLSDCLIAGKIPFYEVRPHKLRVLATFRHLARILTLPDVLDYFELLEIFSNAPASSFITKFEKILNDGAFKMQWKVLIDFIRRYYCFEDSFISHVNHHLFSVNFWEVKEKEEWLIQSYFERSISAEDAYQTLDKILKNRVLDNASFG